MSRNEKLSKLARAVREWRGAHALKKIRPGSLQTKKVCVREPKAAALSRVVRWLGELGMGQAELDLICGFTNYRDFDLWISKQ